MMSIQSRVTTPNVYSRGSEWRKWDLHVHTPGTALADNYFGWDEYVNALKNEKEIVVLGVTDYLSIANYEKLLQIKGNAKLGSIELLIPNIEFRVAPQTDKGHAINLHLFVDPSDSSHCQEISHALARLFVYYEKQPYSCNPNGIAKLGAAYNSALTDDDSRYREGVNQFKVDFTAFSGWYEKETWLNKNSLIAVAGGNDGPSGLKESGWAATQEEIWRFASIIFSGNPNNRTFWLAEDPESREGAIKLGAPKPCINGCDAHSMQTLFKPAMDRYCWIKADPTFEGLRQILYEPDERVHVGKQSPNRHDKSRVISQVSISGGTADAFKSLVLPLNSGLVTIIGQKGSGKSALTDLIAFAGGVDVTSDRKSFLNRASGFLANTSIELKWMDGKTTKAIVGDGAKREQAIRYLSQSFVEKLCSDDYAGTELTTEIENVIFGHLDPTDTLNTSSFTELRKVRTQELSAERLSITSKIRELIAEDEALRETIKALPEKRKRILELDVEKKGLEGQLPQAENEEEAKAQQDLVALRIQLQKLQSTVAGLKQNQLKLQQLRAQIERFKADFEVNRKDLLAKAEEVGVTAAAFDIEFTIRGEMALVDRGTEIVRQIGLLEGLPTQQSDTTIVRTNEKILAAEKLVASDQARRSQIQQIQKRLSSLSQEISRLQGEILKVETTNIARSKTIREARLDTYEKLFQSWKKEQLVLEQLYEPVREKLLKGEKEERMLDFYIRWDVDLDGWLERGGELFDLRKEHPFESPQKFKDLAQSTVVPGWLTGDPTKIRDGMDRFLEGLGGKKIEGFLKKSVSHSILLAWVFGNEHIKLSYGLRYNGTELDKLSPGTKGIVLLILYLAMDSDDSRPLVVDQPEENLDSESIYSLLSHYFRSAKLRRQVIVITHNPNLVVNTDADQVIVATANRAAGAFPEFSYHLGSLENSAGIRDKVCRILEGGQTAFLKREKRYALQTNFE
jgi:ABC-type lipoprotein export system ATPase subunit